MDGNHEPSPLKHVSCREDVASSVTSRPFAELIDGAVALIEETMVKGRRKIRVEHGFDGEIEAFPAELRQVFTNVIKNAVEATDEGGSKLPMLASIAPFCTLRGTDRAIH